MIPVERVSETVMTDVCCVMCGRLDRMHRVCVLRSVEQWRSGLLASSESREGGMCVVIVMNMNGPNKRETEDLKQSLAARVSPRGENRADSKPRTTLQSALATLARRTCVLHG